MVDPDDEYVQSQTNLFSMFSMLIGLIAGLGVLIYTYMLSIAGVKLTTRLRQMTFKAIISQEVGFFDDQKNSVGALCTRLAADCSNVQGVSWT